MQIVSHIVAIMTGFARSAHASIEAFELYVLWTGAELICNWCDIRSTGSIDLEEHVSTARSQVVRHSAGRT